jgi:hypothetical protein
MCTRIICCLILGCLQYQLKAQTLTSGMPVKGADIGHFAAPSLTGSVMGTALVNDDQSPDLFLQGDARKPGTYLYHFKKFTENGTPVFSQPIAVDVPFEDAGANKAVVFQDEQKNIYGCWRFGNKLKFSKFDKVKNKFAALKDINITGLPRGFSSFGVLPLKNNDYLLLFTVQQEGVFNNPAKGPDSSYYTPEGFWPFPLPKSGIYGTLVKDLTNVSSVKVNALTGLEEVTFSISGYALYQDNNENYVIAGSRLGSFYTYKLDQGKGTLEKKKMIVGPDHIIQRHPTVNAIPGYFKAADGKDGLIAAGEGGIYFYKNLRQRDQSGNLVFAKPAHLMQENPILNGGSLVVPNIVDWDGDGILDIISGTSTGHILFFKNTGSNNQPVYQAPVNLQAGGYEIHIQPGYREDIQGPGEARWGYSSPNVYDWNGDGLPDILTGDSRGKFMVYINSGSKTSPKLEAERPLYIDGMNVYGGWRVKPGVGKLDGRNAYIILDRENEFHLYWQLDAYNLEDGGKLTLGDGTYIKANRRPGGQVGRAKIHVVDWDRDGVKDLLIGTGRSNSIPNPTTGLPYNRAVKNEGGAVLFLKNKGTEKRPVYEYPKILKFKGKDMLFGAHDCVPATGPIGSQNENNLLVGTEYGTYIYYKYEDLTW